MHAHDPRTRPEDPLLRSRDARPSRAPRLPSLAVALAGFALATSCGSEAPAPAPFRIEPVVRTALSRSAGLDAEPPTPAPELVERVHGLAAFLATGSEALRDSSRAELLAVGPDAIGPLGGLLADARLDRAQRIAASEALTRFSAAQAAELLLRQVEGSPEPWVRARTAYDLALTAQDWVVPRLVARLSLESDGEVLIGIASTLAHFRNDSGLRYLAAVADGTGGRAQDPAETRAAASEALDRWCAERSAFDAATAIARWEAGDPVLVTSEPVRSPRFEREVWRHIAELSGDDAQRARATFVLSNLSDTAARSLADALHDEDPAIRMHSARCLEAMGPRGVAAGPELVDALRDPQLGPAAALALGRVRYALGLDALLELAAEDTRAPRSLQLASIRGLGRLGERRATPALEALLAEGPASEIGRTAAESLAYLGEVQRALPILADAIESSDAPSTEPAARWWLARAAEREEPGTRSALERWDRPVAPPGLPPSAAERRAQRAERARILRELAAQR